MRKTIRCCLLSVLSLFMVGGAHSANVRCSFMSETTISTSGEWLATEMDFMKLMELFGDGLTLPLENSSSRILIRERFSRRSRKPRKGLSKRR